jgi:hypothetical protein
VSFLAWTFLFGALAVVGPIAAHLLSKPRFRRVPFTMLRFLRSGQRESHSRRRLRDLLVLLLRCAAVVLLAALFARPVLHVTPEPRQERSIHYLALDDSMSMAYRDGSQTLFERMTDAALDHVRRAPDDGAFSVFALAAGRSVYDLNKGQAIAEIRRLRPVPKSASLDDFFAALRQAGQTVSQNDTLGAAVFSDFSPSVLAALGRIAQPAVVDDVQYEPIVPLAPLDNAAIVAAHLGPVTDNQLDFDVTVANYGHVRQRRQLTAHAPALDPVVLEVEVAPQQRGVFRVGMKRSPRLGRSAGAYLPIELTLSPQDGLAEDDTYRVAAYVPPTQRTRLLLVHQARETFLFEAAIEALSQQDRLDAPDLKRVTGDRLSAGDLAWANVAIFSSLPHSAACSPVNVERYLRTGGRLICFATQMQTQEVASMQVARQLWQAGLLPALPDRWMAQTAYPEAQPSTREWFDLNGRAAQSLSGYRLDKIAVKGAWQCRVDPDAQCIWRFAHGTGFIYGKSVSQGSSVFVNTSIDDSLGMLAKSRAWVAFCRYLLGGNDQMRQFCFSTAERPVLHLPETGLMAQLPVENCDGRRTTARVEGTTLRLPAPAGLGWMKTLDGPEVYVPINLPDAETELSASVAETVAAAMQRTFVTDRDKRPASAQAGAEIERKPVWQMLAWATIVLLLAESALANRLKR